MPIQTEFAWALEFGCTTNYVMGEDYEFHEKTEKNIEHFVKKELNFELDYRIKNVDLDIHSFGNIINKTVRPFYQTFEPYRGLRQTIIDFCRQIYNKFCHLVHMVKIEHKHFLTEVLEFGYIRDIKDQKLWKLHWDQHLNQHKKHFEFSCTCVGMCV